MTKRAEIFRALLIFVLFQKTVAPVVKLYPAMAAMMNSSKTFSIRSLLLYNFSDTESIYAIAKELPIPVKFLRTSALGSDCEFAGTIRWNQNRCYTSRDRDLEFLVENRLMFSLQPSFERTPFLKKQIRHILTATPNRILILATHSHKQGLHKFADALCSVITVTSEGINAPHDHYRLCASRKKIYTSALFAQEKLSTFPKHQSLRIATGDVDMPVPLTPEALALLDAYKSLNNTILVLQSLQWLDVRQKRADISLTPISARVLHHFALYSDAHYSPSPRCFFTTMRRFSEMTFIDSWRSLFWLCVCLITLSGIVAIYVSVRCRLLCSRQTRPPFSRIIMFLVSTLLGKSPSSSLANSQAFRSFVSAFWALGMMVLSFYIQSSITAIRLTPVNVMKIASIEELERLALARTVTPCFSIEWHYILPSIMEGKDNFQLRNILKVGVYNPRSLESRSPFSECYRGTQSGTYVALSVCTDDEIAVAAKWSLVPGQHFTTTIQGPGIHIMNPHRYQNRRLLLAIMEAGLAKPQRKIMGPQGTSEQDTAEPFKLYLTPYIVGCGMSCLVFALEVLMQSGLWHFLWQQCARFIQATYNYSFGLRRRLRIRTYP